MAKREWTDEQRKAFAEKMKLSRQNKNPKTTIIVPEVTEEVTEPVLPEETGTKETIDSADYNKLLREVTELKALMFDGMIRNQGAQQGAVGVSNGKLVGTVDKYEMKSAYYPDPRERLKKEAKLQRFAFPMNYDLNFEISESGYTTIDNIRTREPKFTLELVRIVVDEETGEATPGRYTICRLIMHEDPDAAISIARQEGIDVTETNEKAFLDEMRYIRFRDWLLECFYPPKPAPSSLRKDMVIGGKLVQYYEVNSESTAKVDFSTLDKKF